MDDTQSHLDTAQALIIDGEQQRRDGNFDAAIENFTDAITCPIEQGSERNLLLYHAYVCRGTALTQKGEHDAAIDDLSKAILIDPERPLGYYNRAMAWEAKGQEAQAKDDYMRALTLDDEVTREDVSQGEEDA